MRLVATVCLAFSLILGWAASALPQAGGDDLQAKLDAADASLKSVAADLKRESDANRLQSLRAQVDPISDTLQELLARLAPRLDALKEKVDAYGPAPSDPAKVAGEAAATREGRLAAQKTYGDAEAVFRRAKMLEDGASRLQRVIGNRRRTAFTRALFERSPSIFEAGLWSQVAAEWADDVSAMRYLVIDSLDLASQRLTAWETWGLAVLAGLIAVVFVPAWRLARGFVTRERTATNVSRLARALAAIRIAFATAAVPVTAAGALVALGSAFDLYDPRIRPVVLTIFAGVLQVAAAIGIARAVLAPSRPTWRLAAIDDAIAKRLRGAAVTLVAINAVFKVAEAFNEGVAAALPVTVATRAIGTLLMAALAALALVRIERARAAADACRTEPPPTAELRRHWFGLLNIGAWSVVIVAAAATGGGYVAFASFLVDQTIGIAGIAAMLYVLIVLASDGVPSALAPDAFAGRFLLNAMGLRREGLGQLSVLASGALKVVCIGVAALLVLAPWGLQSEDLLGYLRGAFFGFHVGGLVISPANIAVAIVVFALAMLATRSVRSWLETKYLPQTRLAGGLQNSILTSVGYVGFIVAAAVALSYLGLSFEKFAIVAGALSVGIGFGLQSIVSNFVSGLIILWERAIQVGDWIAIGSEQGYVRRITVRSTEIETFERATLILPNSSLVTGTVKNWVRGNKIGRLNLGVGIDYAADPQQAHDILLACANAHERVVAAPAPFVFFTGFGESAMTFELYAYVDDVEKTGRVKSDLYFAVFRAFRAAGIDIPYPQSEVHLRRPAGRGNGAGARA